MTAPPIDFEFTDAHFEKIRELIYRLGGIQLADVKRAMVYSRISRRLRTRGFESFDEYLDLLASDPDHELTEFVNSLTTNLTAFFREKHHFEYLDETVLPDILGRNPGRIRIWSAGCSTGEEPYSIAMVLADNHRKLADVDVKVLATDIDSDVLATASRGVYAADRVEPIGEDRLRRAFYRGGGANVGSYRTKEEIRRFVHFRQLNLLGSWPMKGPFDVIFCRNVVIYFDKPTQTHLFDRYADLLADGGYLMIGHSESLFNVTDRFELIGKSTYRKIR